MTIPSHIALMSALPLPVAPEGQEAPEWIHLLPKPGEGGVLPTGDHRGPYHVTDLQAVADASLAEGGFEIDENHSTYLAAPKGQSAPARGWVREIDVRDDGLWGRVEWTKAGRELVADRAYRGISPALRCDPKNPTAVIRMAGASLVNRPNLRGMTALHQESDMTLAERLAELLGLESHATEEAIIAALKGKMEAKSDTGGTELQAQMGQIAVALGLEEGAEADAVLNAAREAPKDKELTSLQSEIATLTTQLNTVTDDRKREKAETFVDGEIKRGRAGLKPVRDRYVSLHMKDPAEAEALIGAMPVLTGSGTTILPPKPADGSVSLNAEQTAVALQLGMDPKDYAAQLAEDAAQQECR